MTVFKVNNGRLLWVINYQKLRFVFLQATCLSWNGYAAIVDTQEENDFIKSQLTGLSDCKTLYAFQPSFVVIIFVVSDVKQIKRIQGSKFSTISSSVQLAISIFF